MFASRYRFALGLLVGVALTAAFLQLWAICLGHTIIQAAQPRLTIPFAGVVESAMLSRKLPHPWFPETVPSPLEDWQVWTLGGQSLKLSRFRGKVVFLNFMSTSCVPCIAEMPGIERLYATLKGEGVAFLVVSEDDPSLHSFAKEHGAAIPLYVAKEAPPADIALQREPLAVPTTLILDKEGRAVFRHVGGLNWDDPAARQFILGLAAH